MNIPDRTARPRLDIHLPLWLEARAAICEHRTLPDPAERMRLTIELARLNVEHGTGGPFAATVFERDSGRFIALGVNLVTSTGCSIMHGEVVAMTLAQQRLGTFDLGGPGLPAHELVTSTAPCAMCLGAICWSGVRRVLCGAREQDARAIGFDEGPKPAEWVAELEQRHIAVQQDLLRAEARAVLQLYLERHGPIYNSRTDQKSDRSD